MKKCTSRTVLLWMKFLHVLFISIWMGGVFCATVLLTTAFFQWDGAQFAAAVPVLMQIYPKVILPAALLVLLQGICYGLFTNWGFFQHSWIKVKWILAILTGLCTGLGMMRALENVLAKIPLQGFQGGFADGGATLFFLSLQVLFLCMMTGVSICKMRKKPAAR